MSGFTLMSGFDGCLNCGQQPFTLCECEPIDPATIKAFQGMGAVRLRMPEALMILAHGRYFRVPPEAQHVRIGADDWPEYEGPGIPWTRCEEEVTT